MLGVYPVTACITGPFLNFNKFADYCVAVYYFYDRRQPKNMILAGMWFDSKKPPMHMYLKPIFHMLLDLEKTGLLHMTTFYHLMHVWYIYKLGMKLIFPITLYLHAVGVVVDVPGLENPFVMTAHVICCTCDLPGKALVQNILQFNGACGCGFCEQIGKNLRTENGGNVRIFPYQTESPKGEPRTSDACLQYAKEAVETNSVVNT